MDTPIKPTILVVEDEAIVLLDTVALLEDAGFVCLEATSAEAAGTILFEHPEIEALFTDIELSGLCTGIDLAHATHVLNPRMPMIITSGRLRPTGSDLPPGSVFFSKPYRTDMISSTLKRLLAA